MNPLTNVKNLQKLNQRELELGLTDKKSWHDQYKDSAWIFVGGLPYDLTEGDIVCVFSQYGELVNINLVRDKKSGKSKGFCFICYEDQRSTILAVDNFNGIKLLGRTLRVDHVEEYRKPKEHGDEDEITMKLRSEGCAPQIPQSPEHVSSEEEPLQVKVKVKKEKKIKKEKKNKKKKKAARKSSSSESNSDSETDFKPKRVKKEQYDSETEYKQDSIKVKKEKHDPGYDRAEKMNVSQKRSHPPDDLSDQRKTYKYDRDYSEKGAYTARHREYGEDRDRERNCRDRPDQDRNHTRDYGDDYRTDGRCRDTSERDYDRRSYRDRGSDNYSRSRGSDKYDIRDRGNDMYDSRNSRNDKYYSRDRENDKYDNRDRGNDKYERRDRGSDIYDSRSDRYRQDDRDYSDRSSNRDSKR